MICKYYRGFPVSNTQVPYHHSSAFWNQTDARLSTKHIHLHCTFVTRGSCWKFIKTAVPHLKVNNHGPYSTRDPLVSAKFITRKHWWFYLNGNPEESLHKWWRRHLTGSYSDLEAFLLPPCVFWISTQHRSVRKQKAVCEGPWKKAVSSNRICDHQISGGLFLCGLLQKQTNKQKS